MPGNSAIKDKIEKLRPLDKDRSIFGSESHKYELNAPLSDEQIREFENSYSVTIPADYKQFLQTVGDGGAGPFYGLYRLDFNDGITPDIAKPFEYTRKKPFSMMEAYDQIPDDVSDEEHEKTLDDICVRVNRGLVFLATEGCGMYSVLVVNGEEYGNVWYYDLANDAGVFPLTSPVSGKPMKFLEWYELWLDRSIHYLETGEAGFSGYADFVQG